MPVRKNRWLPGTTSFDAAENQLTDDSRSYTYDYENRLKTATLAAMCASSSYDYDGEGRRVRKTGPGGATIFVYDGLGRLMAEYPAQAPADTGLKYVAKDHLGSTRMVTDGAGAVRNRYDYFPFGEEIGQNLRSANVAFPGAGYPSTVVKAVKQEFTGKERDSETGLDYFLARYYSSAQGRFTSPDEWAVGIVDPFTGQQVGQPGPLPYADITDPQTLNKYAYVRNNPLRYTDPDGHCTSFLDCSLTAGSFIAGGVSAGAAAVTAAGTAITGAFGGISWQMAQGNYPQHAGRFGIGADGGFTSIAMREDGTSPSGPGTLGKPDHQQTVKEEAERLDGRTEVPIPTPGGAKGGRRADAVGTNPQTGAPEIVQVYRPTPSGNVPRREKTAAADIQGATGIKPTMVPVRPLKQPGPDPQNQ